MSSSPHYIIDLGGRTFLNVGDQCCVAIDRIKEISFLKTANRGLICHIQFEDSADDFEVIGISQFREFLSSCQIKQ